MSVPLQGMISLTASFQTVLTVNASLSLTVKMMHLVNTSGSAVTVRICYVPSGGTANVGNAALWDFSLPANDFMEFGEGHELEGGTTIQASAGIADVVNLFASGQQN